MAERLNLDEPPIALAGGLLVGDSGLREAFVRQVDLKSRAMTVVIEPAQGALVIARHKHEECYGIVA